MWEKLYLKITKIEVLKIIYFGQERVHLDLYVRAFGSQTVIYDQLLWSQF